jgi:hypothetical protein
MGSMFAKPDIYYFKEPDRPTFDSMFRRFELFELSITDGTHPRRC